MSDTTLVCCPIKNVHTTCTAFTRPTKLIKSPGRKTSSGENQVPEVSGLVNYKKILEIAGIASNATKITSMSRRPVSIAVYELA